jgi:NitT/TauT family transport system permease protein
MSSGPTEARFIKITPWISTLVLLFGVLGLWKVATLYFGISPFILPPYEAVADALAEITVRPDTWTVHARATLIEALAGFGIALASGMVCGILLGNVPWLERAVRPLLIAIQVVPKVALAPLFVIWFGFGPTSKILIAAILAFFPIMLNVQLGVRSVEPLHRDLMRSLNAGRWNTFWFLEFPSALPHVFTGMEVGIIFAVMGAIVGEYLAGSEGLGYMVVVSLNSLNAPALFAVIILLAGLGYTLFMGVSAARRLIIPWHHSMDRKDSF